MRASTVLALALLAVVAAAGVADAAQALKPLKPSADHPGKCYDPDLKLVLAPGETAPAKGQCQSYRCEKSDTGFLLTITTCGSVGVANGCTKVTPNPNAPYPQCCPTVKC